MRASVGLFTFEGLRDQDRAEVGRSERALEGISERADAKEEADDGRAMETGVCCIVGTSTTCPEPTQFSTVT